MIWTFGEVQVAAATSHAVRQDFGWLTRYPVTSEATTLSTRSGRIQARLYRPKGLSDAPALVLVHGIHKDGMDEARLKGFAQSLAATGLVVITPQVLSLSNYHIEKSAVDVIGWSAVALHRQIRRRVGVMGLSFAGGLCLVAAADKRFAPSIGYVLAVGAHDDLERVANFLLTNETPTPGGETLRLQADSYGVLLLAYRYATGLFAPDDVEPGRTALRYWLWGATEKARDQAERLSPEGKATIQAIWNGKGMTILPVLRQQLKGQRAALRSISPHSILARVRCPVFLVHGTHDTVVPYSETQWLAHGLGGRCRVLISPAVDHVEVLAAATPAEKLAVAQFLNEFLTLAHHLR
ncbi:MAG: alpha/beta hydrolase family protein [Acidobacteriota bacterium]